jgi:hypothetical protein
VTLGESAGRTRGNTVRPAARRRMSDAERAQHTHAKDDPQQWPDPPNTVGTIAGRILGVIIMLTIASVVFSIGLRVDLLGKAVCVIVIMLAGNWAGRACRWETTRRL